MSAIYRNSRINRSYLSQIAESGGGTAQLAPDIITDRNRPALPSGELPQAATVQKLLEKAGADVSVLESRHPEIVRAISLLWGFPEMNQYFDRLWLSDGSPGPIDPDAMSELMLLARLHQGIVPQKPTRTMADFFGGSRVHAAATTPHDPWRDVPRRR